MDACVAEVRLGRLSDDEVSELRAGGTDEAGVEGVGANGLEERFLGVAVDLCEAVQGFSVAT